MRSATIFFAAFLGLQAAPFLALTLYVSPQGNDLWTGLSASPNQEHSNGPLASLTGARNAIRRWRAGGGAGETCEVRIKGGVYFLAEPFILGPEDSGTPTHPVIFTADGAGRPRMVGGLLLAAGPAKQTGEIQQFARPTNLPPPTAARPESRLGTLSPPFELFYDRRRLPLARWPDAPATNTVADGWAYVEAVPPKNGNDSFICRALPAWLAEEKQAEIHIFTGYGWTDTVCAIKSYDPATGVVVLTRPTYYSITAGDRFFVKNARAALDHPGEWYATTNTLLLMRPAAKPSLDVEHELLVSRLQNVLVLRGVSHLVITGVAWEASTGTTVVMENVSACRFDGNIVGLSGGWGIEATSDHPLSILNNVIYATGLGGIRLKGGNSATLSPARITVAGNELFETGQRLKCSEPALALAGVGLSITHNYLHDLPHTAISIEGNNHLIAHNLIENVCRETSDAGAIYAGRNWAERGTIITSNVIRRIYGWQLLNRSALSDGREHQAHYATSDSVHCIYLDDLTEHSTIRDNLFADVGAPALHLGGGSYHQISGNYFLRCAIGLWISERASFEAQLNRLKPFDYSGSPYRTAYPEIVDRASRTPLIPAALEVEGNHFAQVPLSYKIRVMAPTNSFAHNHFSAVAPQCSAAIQRNGFRQAISTWQDWQLAGFDRDAIYNRKVPPEESAAVNTIIQQAGPQTNTSANLRRELPSVMSSAPPQASTVELQHQN
jgi:hypothetical protein